MCGQAHPTPKEPHMTPKERKQAISLITEAYYTAENHGDPYECRDARDIAAKQERQHRRMGVSWVGAEQARCLVSVDVCAMLFAARGFYAPKRSRSCSDRDDFVKAYGAAERAERRDPKRYKADCAKFRKAIQAIDYVALVGHK